MKLAKKFSVRITVILSILILFCGVAHAADPVKNVVLVHGAFADGSGWDQVIPLLQAQGLNVVAVQNPLTSLADDVATTNRAINALSGPIVLVGHSWGGVVISEAGKNPKVSNLVYVAAFAPSEGQSAMDLNKDFPEAPGFRKIKADAEGFVTLTPEGMSQEFAQDVSEAKAKLMTAVQGPIAGKCFQEKIADAAWKNKKSWFVVAEQDHMIQPDLQRSLAKKLNAVTTSLPTSHVPMISSPQAVTDVILAAVAEAK